MKVALQLCWEEKAEKTEPKILIEREEFLDDPIEFRRKKRKRKKRIEKRKMEKKKKKSRIRIVISPASHVSNTQ